MASVSSSITINQPVEKVFTYVTSIDNHKAWQEGIVDARVSPAGPVGLGSVYTYTSKVMGRQMESQMKIAAFEPNRVWAIQTTNVPQPVTTVYQFEDAGGKTNLTISMELTGGYPAAAEGMIKNQMQKSLNEQGSRIKKLVEG